MASWLRLWHDMPNDPKWRTIARIAEQPISLVQSAYLHMLVDASRNVTRGHADVTIEDLASALDVTEDAISAIIDAMQGRVLDGRFVTGWDKRQPSREDAVGIENGAKTAAERKREQRERERDKENSTKCHDKSRNVTQCHAPDTDTDTDTDKKEEQKTKPTRKRASPSARVEVTEAEMLESGITPAVASEYLQYRKAKRAPLTPLAWRRILSEIEKSGIGVEGALSQAMARGWQGFEADWLREKSRAGPYAESPADKRRRENHDFWGQINDTGNRQQRGDVPAAIDGEAVRVD